MKSGIGGTSVAGVRLMCRVRVRVRFWGQRKNLGHNAECLVKSISLSFQVAGVFKAGSNWNGEQNLTIDGRESFTGDMSFNDVVVKICVLAVVNFFLCSTKHEFIVGVPQRTCAIPKVFDE